MKKKMTVLAFVAFLFAVCAPGVESAEAPQYGGVFKVVNWTGPGSPIGWPPETASVTDAAMGIPALEPLLRIRNVDLSTEPMLATSWTIAPDRKSITFTLRKGVKFHDGADWNAEAAKFNLDALQAAKVGRAGTDLWASVVVVDDYTVRVDLTAWANTILESIGTQLMVSPKAFKTMGAEKMRWNPIGTGAFTFVSHERDVATRFKRFDGYWQKGKPYLDGVELLYGMDPMTQSAIMLKGDAQALWSPNLKIGADLKARGFQSVYLHDGTQSFVPDSANPDSPFADKRVREALEYATDKDALREAFGYGFWETAYQIATPINAGHIPDFKGRRYDPAKAKALLAEAGYPKGFKTKLMGFPGTAKEIVTGLQGYLDEAGIKSDIEWPLMGKLIEYRRKGWRNALIVAPWMVFPNLARTLVNYQLSGDYISVKRPAGLEDLVKEALSTLKTEPEKTQKLVRMIYDEATLIPLWHIGSPRSLQKGVRDANFFAYVGDIWSPESAWMAK